MLTIDPRIKLDDKYDNEYDNTTTSFFVADTSLLKELVGDKYPEADGMTICMKHPINCFDASKAIVGISPLKEIDGILTDYDYFTTINLPHDKIYALMTLAIKHENTKESFSHSEECLNKIDALLDLAMKQEQSKKQPMEKNKIKFIHKSLGESKDFVKEVRQYLYEIEKQRPLTEIEQKLWNKTHDIHVHTEDSRMFIQEEYDDIY